MAGENSIAGGETYGSGQPVIHTLEFSDLKAPTPDDSRKAPTMKVDYRNLSAVKIETGTRYRRPTQDFESAINRDSPALLVMTDLCKVAAVTVEPNVSIDVALEKMKSSGVRSLLVIDTQQEIVGLITATDIQGEKPLQFTQDNGVSHADILVRDIMTKRDDMDAMPIESVQDARVGDIVETLKRAGRQHALVVENGDGEPFIRGIFSVTQIGRTLGIKLENAGFAATFAELEKALTASIT